MNLPSSATFESESSDREVFLLAELVRLSPVTLLLAEEGSDKSTFLRTRVLPLLQDTSAPDEAGIFFDAWDGPLLPALIDQARSAVTATVGLPMSDADPAAGSLAETLISWQQTFQLRFIFVFDRFEEYLARHADDASVKDFREQLVLALNTSSLRINVLISLEEAAAPLLAPFRERVPEFGDASLRLPRPSKRAEPVSSDLNHHAETHADAVLEQSSTATVPVDRGIRETAPLPQVAAIEAEIEADLLGTTPAGPRPETNKAKAGDFLAITTAAPLLQAELEATTVSSSATTNRETIVPDDSLVAAAPAPILPADLTTTETSVERNTKSRASASDDSLTAAAPPTRLAADLSTTKSSPDNSAAVSSERNEPRVEPVPAPILLADRIATTTYGRARTNVKVIRADEPRLRTSETPEQHGRSDVFRVPSNVEPPHKTSSDQMSRLGSRRWLGVGVLVLTLLTLLVLTPWERLRRESDPASSAPVTQEPASGAASSNAALQPNFPASPADEPTVLMRDERSASGSRIPELADEPALLVPPAPSPPASPSASAKRVNPDSRQTRAPAVTSPKAVAGDKGLARSIPMVYIHVRSQAQRVGVSKYVKLLSGRGIHVSGIKLVSAGPTGPDLRYFRAQDAREAAYVARVLNESGLVSSPRLKLISGYENNSTPRQYELWLPPG